MFFAQSPEESLWGECEEDREAVDAVKIESIGRGSL